jgi:hypothetical protein
LYVIVHGIGARIRFVLVVFGFIASATSESQYAYGQATKARKRRHGGLLWVGGWNDAKEVVPGSVRQAFYLLSTLSADGKTIGDDDVR